uniref:Cytochrome c oxidase assembly factor 5 n=1 Tax=Strigamia maritima TaxID=126957 RepID=T1IQD0_STRMM
MSGYARYYSEADQIEDKRPCAGLRADLRDCIMQSDCVKIHKKSPKECLATKDLTVPDECHQLRQAFFECKRSLLDNRQRFRGRKGY